MNTSFLQIIVSALIGATILVNGVILKTDDITTAATEAVNSANLHQIATALELYYFDHDSYPIAQSGDELVGILAEEGLIRNRPLNQNVFEYQQLEEGQDYLLKLADNY